MRLVLATRNDHKLRELSELMRPYELDPLPDDVELPPETGTTFADNALGKARAAAAAPRARPAMADDSGIEAAALGGAPGVWSARYAGEGATDEENLAKLLREVPADGDRARGLRVRARLRGAGRARGGRARALRGAARARAARRAAASATTPPSCPDDYPGDERTMAELTPEEKDAISHRGRAARALVLRLLQAPRRPSGRRGALRSLLGGGRAPAQGRPR